jgi:hypothetical protein
MLEVHTFQRLCHVDYHTYLRPKMITLHEPCNITHSYTSMDTTSRAILSACIS